MSKRPLAWWVWPSVLTGSVAALGALGSVAVNYATFAGLPKRVEAGEQKNVAQDEDIVDLKGIAKEIQGYTKAMSQNAAAPVTRTEGLREYEDDVGFWCCQVPSAEWRQWCFEANQWYRCD